MSTVVNEIPKKARKSKYDYETLFNGEIHRLVQGEDFDVAQASVRGALYTHKAVHNRANPSNQIGLKVHFNEENGVKVVYVQKTEPRVRKSAETKADKPKAEAKPKTTKPKTGRKPVSPTR